jgi:hypothetical protein
MSAQPTVPNKAPHETTPDLHANPLLQLLSLQLLSLQLLTRINAVRRLGQKLSLFYFYAKTLDCLLLRQL